MSNGVVDYLEGEKKTENLLLCWTVKMISRTTFIGYLDRIDYADSMSNEELWMLFRKILQHENQVEEIDLPLEFRFVRIKIQKKLDENTEKRKTKVEDVREKRSNAWKSHYWNQYTRQNDKRYSQKQAKKTSMEQMEQNGTNGTNGTISECIHNISSSSSKKEEKNIRKEEMLEAFRNDERLTPYMDEEYVCKWWDFKEWTKKPYKNIDSFITMLVKMKNKIKNYWGMPKSDRNRRNRFKFMVDTAIEKQREGLDWYDFMEPQYESSKDDLYPNPKQNE